MSEIEQLSKWTTTASAYAISGAALYTAGYFQIVGRLWMPMITTAEMVAFFVASSQAVVMLSAFTVGVLFVLHLLNRVPFLSFTKNGHHIFRAVLTFFLVIVTISSLVILRYRALNYSSEISINFNYVMMPICIAIALSYFLLKEYSDVIPGQLLFLVLSILISCNISGMYAARKKMSSEYVSTVHLSNGKTQCGNVIFSGSKGIIISGATPKAREFIKYEQYNRIYAGGKCEVAKSPPANSKSAKLVSATSR